VALLLIYTLSGVTALAYQVLWARMLSLQFGVSIFGVVVTAAAFMLGLGAGSVLGTRLLNRIRRPLLLFALLEAAIAGFAITLPLIQQGLDGLLGHISAGQGLYGWYALQSVVALLVLTLPALAMGLGFPVVLRVGESHSLSLGLIYGLNTGGGALGALLPLLLLPLLGWKLANWSVASLGSLVAVSSLLLAAQISRTAAASVVTPSRSRPAWRYLLAYAGIGAAALILEIGWVRLYGMVLLRTEYVLAIILATFLAGIGLGSVLARRAGTTRWLDWLPLFTAVAGIASLWFLPWLAGWVERTVFHSLGHALWLQGMALMACTIPVTFLLGAWLPLLSHYLAEGDQTHTTGAWLYGANSLGAAVGSVLAGFVLLPVLGTTATVVTAALALFVFGMVWSASPRHWLALPLVVLLALPVIKMPTVNTLLPASQGGSDNLFVYEDAVSITHVVRQNDGQRLLLADLQRMDASSEPTAVVSQQNQARLPLLLHEQPRSVLFLGLGTGISAAGALPYPDLDITAVELSRGAVLAAESWFVKVNDHVTRHIEVVRDDARRYLRTTRSSYDVIIGDLFHPDLVGRSTLLSVQQFQRAARRLNDRGVFVQWLALNQFDVNALKVVLRSFKHVFPDAVLFLDGFRLALVGPADRFGGAGAVQANLARLTDPQLDAATGGEGAWSWLGRYWGPLTVEGAGPVQDEWAPRIEYDLPRARYAGQLDVQSPLQWLLEQRPHVNRARQLLQIRAADGEAFERGYVATELAVRSWLAGMKQNSVESQRLIRLAWEANPRDRWIGYALADQMLQGLEQAVSRGLDRQTALQSILEIRPDHPEVLRALWQMAQQADDVERAMVYGEKVQALSPYSSVFENR
jgi:spermidine synthase